MNPAETLADRLLYLCDEAITGRLDPKIADDLCAKYGPALMLIVLAQKREARAEEGPA